jgi:hypothetical protein
MKILAHKSPLSLWRGSRGGYARRRSSSARLGGESRWRFTEAAYVRVLLEPGEADLNEDSGVVEGFLRQLPGT